jgi:predicted O-methyltransferase YrrM
MVHVYKVDQWDRYLVDWFDPHRQIEPLEREIEVIDGALMMLVDAGALPHSQYDHKKMLALRTAVRERFDIPWTAISPRMQRLLYAINAIAQPRVMAAVGIFCGNTFIANAGAAIGPGACYKPLRLVGIEIRPDEAARARRNVAQIDGNGRAEIITADGIAWLRDFDGIIDLLYLDADGASESSIGRFLRKIEVSTQRPIFGNIRRSHPNLWHALSSSVGRLLRLSTPAVENPRKGKAIYLNMLEAALHALRPGSLVLAHDSIAAVHDMADYLAYVRDPANFRESISMVIDDHGLEVSVR